MRIIICLVLLLSQLMAFAEGFQKSEKLLYDGHLLSATYHFSEDGQMSNEPFISLVGPNTRIYGDTFPILYGSPQSVIDTLNTWNTICLSLKKQDGLSYEDDNGFTFTYQHYSFPLASVYEVKFPTGQIATFGEKDFDKYIKKLKKWCVKKKIQIQ